MPVDAADDGKRQVGFFPAVRHRGIDALGLDVEPDIVDPLALFFQNNQHVDDRTAAQAGDHQAHGPETGGVAAGCFRQVDADVVAARIGGEHGMAVGAAAEVDVHDRVCLICPNARSPELFVAGVKNFFLPLEVHVGNAKTIICNF